MVKREGFLVLYRVEEYLSYFWVLLLFDFVGSCSEYFGDVVCSDCVSSFESHKVVGVGSIEPSVVLFDDGCGLLSESLHGYWINLFLIINQYK